MESIYYKWNTLCKPHFRNLCSIYIGVRHIYISGILVYLWKINNKIYTTFKISEQVNGAGTETAREL